MPALGTIADRIAAAYAAAGAPAGARAIRGATADLPNVIGGDVPYVLVFPDAGTYLAGNGTRLGHQDWFARLYYDEAGAGDLPRDTSALMDYATLLSDLHLTGMQLAGAVTALRTTGWRVGFLPYAGKRYTGLELKLETVTTEPWAPTP